MDTDAQKVPQASRLAFWRDPIWQSIAALLALLALVIGAYEFFVSRPSKKLSYEVISITKIVDSNPEIKKKIQVFFENKLVQDPFIINLKFSNSGNVSIKRSDYDSPLKFFLNSNCVLLDSYVKEQKPSNINSSVFIENGAVVVSKTLLNPGDFVNIVILTSKCQPKVFGSVRIDGVKEIELFESVKLDSNIIHRGDYISMITLLLLFILTPGVLAEGKFIILRRSIYLVTILLLIFIALDTISLLHYIHL